MTRMLIYLGILGVALVVGINFFKGKMGGFSNIPKEVQIRYVPADFHPDLDVENALEILTNPYRYEREFDELIRDFNLSLLFHVARRMDLPDSLMSRLRGEYEQHHTYLHQLYFNDFVQLQDTSSRFYQQWYGSESADAVTLLNEVASKYTCWFVNHILGTLLETQEGRIFVSGNKVDTPCGVVMGEALKPMMDRLQQSAAIRDFSRSKGFLEERVERVTAELATMEIRDKKGLNKQMQTKLMGFNISSTELEVTAVSVMKIGFNLQKFFDIRLDASRNTVVVTLPEPEILSHEVYPKVDKLDIGWLREVENEDFNRNFNLLRKEFRREALESDIMDKAKVQAAELMETMLGPLMASKKLQLKVNFQQVNASLDEQRIDAQ